MGREVDAMTYNQSTNVEATKLVIGLKKSLIQFRIFNHHIHNTNNLSVFSNREFVIINAKMFGAVIVENGLKAMI